MDQLLCKEFCFSSGDYNVQKSRTGWVVLVEGLTSNGIANCKKLFPIWTSSSDFFKYFLSRALAAILDGGAESFAQFLEVNEL